MRFEKYIHVFKSEEGVNLRPKGKEYVTEFELDVKEDKNYRLFTVGETQSFCWWKNEPHNPAWYQDISDALDTKHANCAQFCLDFSSQKKEGYPKRLYKKLMCDPVILAYRPLINPESTWEFGVYATGKHIEIAKDGYLRMRIDVRYKKEGVSRLETVLPPDETHIIDFCKGKFDFTRISKQVTLKSDELSSIGIWIEGLKYSGKLYLESPFMMNTGFQLLPDFVPAVPNKEAFNWTGQNISRKEWPEFRVKLNGKTIFEDAVFERCHLHSEWAIDIPKKLLKKKNKLSYELISDYHDPLPYNIYSVGIIEQKGGEFSVISTSYAGVENKNAYVLIRTGKDNAKVFVNYENENLTGEKDYTFKKAGLHGIKLLCKNACTHAKFTLSCNKTAVECEIPVIVKRKEDHVLLGTGDMVYINQNIADTEEYLSWYISEGVGNFLTIRPVYRWCGTRTINPKVWELVTRVLNELDIKYVIMTDGRELPGLNCNPDDKMLAGKNYVGRQNHERDGKAFYWGIRDGKLTDTQMQYNDMLTQMRKEYPENSQFTPIDCAYFGNEVYPAVTPYYSHDVKEVREQTVQRLKEWKTGTRHTGPSHMYKYLLDAGYTWLGAETMYSNLEMQMCMLRGLAKCKGIDSFGVHHALQWSTAPHDDEAKYRRFRLALYLSYMLGATDINTEEGLWRLEEFFAKFHRFTKPCIAYTKQHQDLYKYIQTHAREGKFHTPVALIHGRLDGTVGWGKGSPWGLYGFGESDFENSWDLIRIFYPNALVNNQIYALPCPEDKPVGFYSGTPFGNIDILPIEYANDSYKDYNAVIFMGYNLAQTEDFDHLMDYARQGGTVLLTRAHLTTTSNLDDVKGGKLEFLNTPMSFTNGEPEFIESCYKGISLKVCTNAKPASEILAKTDDGLPLVLKYKVSEGNVILFNTSEYPAHRAIKDLYENKIKNISKAAILKEPAWVKADETVEFSVYKTENTTHIYFLAVDWFHNPNKMRAATLVLNGTEYKVDVPFGTMIKCVINKNQAVWSCGENGDVLQVSDFGMKLQGTGVCDFVIAKDGKMHKVTVDFNDAPIKTIS